MDKLSAADMARLELGLDTGSLKEVKEWDLMEQFNNYFDEVNSPVMIGGLGPYSPSQVLIEVDPIAHRQEFLSYVDMCCQQDLLEVGFDCYVNLDEALIYLESVKRGDPA